MSCFFFFFLCNMRFLVYVLWSVLATGCRLLESESGNWQQAQFDISTRFVLCQGFGPKTAGHGEMTCKIEGLYQSFFWFRADLHHDSLISSEFFFFRVKRHLPSMSGDSAQVLPLWAFDQFIITCLAQQIPSLR